MVMGTNIRRLVIALLVALTVMGTAPSVRADSVLTLGILSFRPHEEIEQNWTPLAEYLSRALVGYQVRLVAVGYEELEQALDHNELDFVLTNPSHYIRIRSKNSLSGVLATLVVEEQGRAVTGFGGVVITHAESTDITDWEDLAGRSIAAVAEGSLGGYQAQVFELHRRGLRQAVRGGITFTGMPHDRVVEAVLSGQVEVGFLRTGVLESLIADGTLEAGQVRVVAAEDLPGYPFQISTRLYPEWPFVSLAHVEESVANRVAAALLLLERGAPEARSAGLVGFAVPADYGGVETLARTLRLPPYDSSPPIELRDVWQRYWVELILAATLAALVVGLALWLVVMNRHLSLARIRANQAMREVAQERQRLSNIIWATHVGTWEWNIQTGESVFNERWAEIGGYTLAELAPVSFQTWVDLVHPDDLKNSNRLLEQHFSGKTGGYDCEVRMRHRQGQWVWVLTRGRVVTWTKDHKPEWMVGTHLDITARKLVELELRRVSSRLELILNSANEGICGLDQNGYTIFANRAASEMLGYTQAELLGTNQHDLVHHTRANGTPYPLSDCPIVAAQREGSVSEVSDEVFWRKDGTSFPVEYVASPVAGADGAIVGAMVVFRNISERTRLMHELERSNAELEQFAYVASHDLRQPLRMVNSYTQLLERSLKDKLDDQTREFMGYVRDGAMRMDAMLVSLLEYSRVGRMGEPLALVNSRTLLEEALQFLSPSSTEAGAEVTVSGDWPVVLASHNEGVRLFQNLIGNALKYRSPETPPVISVHVEPRGPDWLFSIRDNGIGIDPKQFERLFKVFQRLHTRSTYEGTGIGLAVCRKIVERHGGTIWVESEGEGLGSTFRFTLPKDAKAGKA